MNLNSTLLLDFKNLNEFYFKLLIQEDFEFKTKDISIDIIQLENKKINISFIANSIIDLKIASNSIIKSLEIIEKTLSTI
jgi:hypothetical protein